MAMALITLVSSSWKAKMVSSNSWVKAEKVTNNSQVCTRFCFKRYISNLVLQHEKGLFLVKCPWILKVYYCTLKASCISQGKNSIDHILLTTMQQNLKYIIKIKRKFEYSKLIKIFLIDFVNLNNKYCVYFFLVFESYFTI